VFNQNNNDLAMIWQTYRVHDILNKHLFTKCPTGLAAKFFPVTNAILRNDTYINQWILKFCNQTTLEIPVVFGEMDGDNSI